MESRPHPSPGWNEFVRSFDEESNVSRAGDPSYGMIGDTRFANDRNRCFPLPPELGSSNRGQVLESNPFDKQKNTG